MSKPVRWENPPTPERPHTKNGAFNGAAEALRRRPGKWAVIREVERQSTAYSYANLIKSGQGVWAPPGAFEATSRKTATGAIIYARYVGEVSP